MLKNYDELIKIDVTPYCDMRDAKDDKGKPIKVPYLNWAKCKELLHENGAQTVYFEPVTLPNGSSLIMSDAAFADKNGVTNRCYEVRVKIVIDDLEFESQFPLMNGSNPVKDNSLTQQRLWNAQTRAFVKGVAIRTGLGFKLWSGAEEDKTPDDYSENLELHRLDKIKERVEQRITKLLQRKETKETIALKLGKSVEEIDMLLKYYGVLYRFEEALKNL